MYIFVVFSKEQDRKYSIHLFRVWERPITWSRLCALIYKRQFMLKVVDSKKFPSLFQAQMGKVWCYIYIKSIFAGKNCISKGFCKRKNRKSWGFSCIRFFFAFYDDLSKVGTFLLVCTVGEIIILDARFSWFHEHSAEYRMDACAHIKAFPSS